VKFVAKNRQLLPATQIKYFVDLSRQLEKNGEASQLKEEAPAN